MGEDSSDSCGKDNQNTLEDCLKDFNPKHNQALYWQNEWLKWESSEKSFFFGVVTRIGWSESLEDNVNLHFWLLWTSITDERKS